MVNAKLVSTSGSDPIPPRFRLQAHRQIQKACLPIMTSYSVNFRENVHLKIYTKKNIDKQLYSYFIGYKTHLINLIKSVMFVMNLSSVKGSGRQTNDAYVFVISEDTDIVREEDSSGLNCVP